LADTDAEVAVACRVLGVSRSGYYQWLNRPVSARQRDNELLSKYIAEIHAESRGTYGWPRVHAELTLGLGLAVNHKRVRRLMRLAGLQGVHQRRRRRDQSAEASEDDLVHRQFSVDAPDRLWLTNITEHRTAQGKVYCAAVVDAFSRRVIGWSIAAHMRTDLVSEALGMALLRRNPAGDATVVHSDHGAQYTSWAFGQRVRKAGLLPSMGTIGDCYDNAMMESFWSTLQREVLDRNVWPTRDGLANAIFEWIECWYNPKRRHSSLGMLSPIDFEARHTAPDPTTPQACQLR